MSLHVSWVTLHVSDCPDISPVWSGRVVVQSDFVASEFRNITFRVCSDILIFSKDDVEYGDLGEYGTEVCLGSHSEVGALLLTSMILYLGGVWGVVSPKLWTSHDPPTHRHIVHCPFQLTKALIF